MNQLFFLGLRARALLDQEEKMTVEQRAHEATTELAALAISGQALCDVVLGVGQADT
jgi:hypothetical protein